MRTFPESKIDASHPDHALLAEIRDAIYAATGGADRFEASIPDLLRRAIDEVIDTARTARISLNELEKTEKTYVGTKVEIVLRDFLGFPKGRLDFRIGEHDVDVKNTVASGWMIPREAIDRPCMLVAEDEEGGLCHCGLIVAKADYLGAGRNRDQKGSISVDGLRHVLWLFRDTQFSQGFWFGRDPEVVRAIMDGRISGAERVRRLFRLIQRTQIDREVIVGVARQLDPLRRIRGSDGARGPLGDEGIVILSGASVHHRRAIEELGLPRCCKSEFVSFTPEIDREREILKTCGV